MGGRFITKNELTFSLTAHKSDPLYHGPITDSYARVHTALIAALESVGVQAQLRQEQALQSDRQGTGMCFHHSTALDIVWEGRKGIGSAQRRRAERVLHHGSIKLGTTPLEGSIATTGETAGVHQPLDLIPVLCAAFEEHLGMRLKACVPHPEERELAAVLVPKYSSEAFLYRR